MKSMAEGRDVVHLHPVRVTSVAHSTRLPLIGLSSFAKAGLRSSTRRCAGQRNSPPPVLLLLLLLHLPVKLLDLPAPLRHPGLPHTQLPRHVQLLLLLQNAGRHGTRQLHPQSFQKLGAP